MAVGGGVSRRMDVDKHPDRAEVDNFTPLNCESNHLDPWRQRKCLGSGLAVTF
jgi:hypothetical protein